MCDCCQEASSLALRRNNRDCWTIPPRTREIRTKNGCHHSTRELIRTTTSPPLCYDLDTTVAHACCTPYTYRSQTQSHPTRLEFYLQEILSCCIEDEPQECTCEQRRERCTICEQDQHLLICELMDLLERLGSTNDTNGGGRWRCRPPTQRPNHGCRREAECCTDNLAHREVKTETQTLFEVLFRITRRKSFRSGSHLRGGGRSGNGSGDGGLQRIIRQLLDELEETGGCDCRDCREYFEVNLRRVKRALREDVNDGVEGRRCRCDGYCGGVTKVICERPARGTKRNVHFGWSSR